MTGMRFLSFLLVAVLAAPPGMANKPVSPRKLFSQKLPSDRQLVHALNRLTFGPRPGDTERVRSMGIKKWVDLQLHPEAIQEDPVVEEKLAVLDTLKMSPADLAVKYPRRQAGARPAIRPAAARSSAERRQMLYSVAPPQVIGYDLVEAKLLRAIYSNRQLQEVLTDFWYNHFNVFLDKGADRYLATSYERDAIRPHVLAKFKDLLLATAKSPAMLFYLDNWESVDPAAAERLGRLRPQIARMRRGLNENYARELMELHTLGVDGGYTQKDVVEVARCFTGWTIRNPRAGGSFAFDERMHDRGQKTVLGVKIPAGGGQEDGLKVLDILAHHPSTARFISRKLAQRFVADTPPEALVAEMAKTFTKKDGDIREVLKTMFASRAFWSEGAWLAKLKSPLEAVAGAARALDAEVDSAFALAQKVARLGEPLYRKQEPTGYSNSSEEWMGSSSLVGRMNFALALAAGRIPGVRLNAGRLGGSTDPGQMATAILGQALSPEAAVAVEKAIEEAGPAGSRPVLAAGLILGSPDFQRR